MSKSTQADDETAPTPSISREDLFEILGNERRRHTLKAILRQEGRVELGELADRVAARENDKSLEAVTPAERKRTYTALRQTHLPKMEEKGLVTCDYERAIVKPAEKLADVDVYLEIVGPRRVPFSVVYLGLAAVSAIALVGSWAEVSPLTAAPDVVWVSVLTGIFGATALVHLFSMRRMKLEPTELSPGSPAEAERGDEDGATGVASLPGTALATVLAGGAAGVAMGAILHYVLFMMPLVGAVYGRPSILWGWIAHLAHSLAFAVPFGIAASGIRPRSYPETTALGVLYGIGLWVVVEGVAVPVVSNVDLPTLITVAGYELLYIPLDGLAAHVVYGAVLGSVFVAVHRALDR